MSNEIEIHPKYQPFYELLEGKHKEVDTVIITGGRYSAKSFNIGLWSVIALVQHHFSILFTRFTNSSIVDSIKPNVDDKIDLLGFQKYVNNTNTHIERTIDGKTERIAFKGMKTGSKQQTASLKSLEGFNVFIVDEADETPDYETYEKVYLSIRSIEKRNISVMVLNSQSVHHWIYKKFYKEHGLKGGENVIIDNVMYIHTSYLDLAKKHIPTNFLKYYEKLKENNIKKYNHVVLGEWISEVEGAVFTDFKKISYLEFLSIEAIEHYSTDFGAHDPMAVSSWKFVSKGENDYHLYFHERHYKSENDVRSEMDESIRSNYKKEDGGILKYIINKLELDKNKINLCDQGGNVDDYRANNYKIRILQQLGYTKAIPAPKEPGSIHFSNELLKNINVYYTKESKNIEFEVENYTLESDREGFIEGKYIDKNNHQIDVMKNVAYYLFKTGLIKKVI